MLEESLSQNNYLSQEVKGNIIELVNIFKSRFPSINLDSFYEKLKTLQIKKISKFLSSNISKYDISENIIYFNLNELKKDYDMKYVLMYELLNVISANGFNDHDSYLALNAGFTEILANLLVGNESTPIYKEEAAYANIISIMVGVDVLEDAYFKNDSGILTEALNRIGVVKK